MRDHCMVQDFWLAALLLIRRTAGVTRLPYGLDQANTHHTPTQPHSHYARILVRMYHNMNVGTPTSLAHVAVFYWFICLSFCIEGTLFDWNSFYFSCSTYLWNNGKGIRKYQVKESRVIQAFIVDMEQWFLVHNYSLLLFCSTIRFCLFLSQNLFEHLQQLSFILRHATLPITLILRLLDQIWNVRSVHFLELTSHLD